MKGARHDQAVALLTGHSENEVYLVVQRGKNFVMSPLTATATASPVNVTTSTRSFTAPLATSSPNPTPFSTLTHPPASGNSASTVAPRVSPSPAFRYTGAGDESWDGLSEVR